MLTYIQKCYCYKNKHMATSYLYGCAGASRTPI